MTDKPTELNTSPDLIGDLPKNPFILTVHQADIIRNQIYQNSSLLLGAPYTYGAKSDDHVNIPKELDCSGLVAWSYRKAGLKVPDGSQNQFNFTISTDKPKTGDMAFFAHDKDITKVYHVGLVYDADRMIEARAFDPKASFKTGCVILRPIERWKNWKDFSGFRIHPKLLTA